MKTTQLMIMVLISLVWATAATALDVNLQWVPNTDSDLAGYRVYYGVNGLSNPISINVQSPTQGAAIPTTVTITGLDPTLNYYFAATAYNTSGLEGPYSNIVTEFETIPPVVSAFTLPASATSQTVPIISFTATDNAGVTGYLITGSNAVPDANTANWSTTAPTTFTFPITGFVIAYAWAKDASGNISA